MKLNIMIDTDDIDGDEAEAWEAIQWWHRMAVNDDMQNGTRTLTTPSAVAKAAAIRFIVNTVDMYRDHMLLSADRAIIAAYNAQNTNR